jgi:cell wall-associated NlpC family hydrolase
MRELPGCAYPSPLLASRTCDVPAPPVRLPRQTSDLVIRVVKRQAPVFVIALAAACVAAGTATGDPSVGAKRAQAQQVMAQISQLDSNLERARTLYIASTQKLQVIEHNQKINKVALRAARANLKRSQHTLMQRLVTIYTTRDDHSTLAVLLGATSIDDLVNRIETVQSVSAQDIAVLHEVVGFKKVVTRTRHALTVAHRTQQRLVQQRAAAKARISSQLSRQQRLLASIKGEIARILAANRARALAAANAARARYDAAQQASALALQQTVVGATASTGDGSVAPPSQYGGVVGIAMRYLGVPYVWGGESPAGFDCSGLVAYVYSQVGVSLPHYTGAQWNMGVPVARSDLQPGDLVFFDGLGHVGIYVGGNEFIHAPHTGDVVKISSMTGWYADTYVGARRITG